MPANLPGPAASADRTPTAQRDADRTDADGAPTRADRVPARAEPPALPTRSEDDSDAGWGDDLPARDDDWYRRERPPHWDE